MIDHPLDIDQLLEHCPFDPRNHCRSRGDESMLGVVFGERVLQRFVRLLWGISLLAHVRRPSLGQWGNSNGMIDTRVDRNRETALAVASADIRSLDVPLLLAAEGRFQLELVPRSLLCPSKAVEPFSVTSR